MQQASTIIPATLRHQGAKARLADNFLLDLSLKQP